MKNQKQDKEKKTHVIIGTIGHVNHEKTTLTEAIKKMLEENGYKSLESKEESPKKYIK